MKSLLFTLVICTFAHLAMSQTQVTINKGKKNAALFDDSSPSSFFGILTTSSENLGYFIEEGMDNTLVASLSPSEKVKLLAYQSNESYVVYDEFGEELIVFDPITGIADLAYTYPDTVFTSVDNIERIVLNIATGDGNQFSRIKSIELWKKYEGKIHRVLTLSADILSLKGFKYIEPLTESIQADWLDKKPNALWNQMKVAALETFERNRVMDGGDKEMDFSMSFLPTNYDFSFYYFLMASNSALGKIDEEANYLYSRNYYKSDYMPFLFSYGDALAADSNNRIQIESNFFDIKRHWFYSLSPLYQDDPDLPGYNQPLTKVMDDGSVELMYEDPELSYIWLDYEGIQVFAVKEFSSTEEGSAIQSQLVGLIFTKKTKSGKPEVVSYMPTEGVFQSQFSDYPIEQLSTLPWYEMLQKEMNRNKKSN